MALRLKKNGEYLKIDKTLCYVDGFNTMIGYRTYRTTTDRENEKNELDLYNESFNKVKEYADEQYKIYLNTTNEEERKRIESNVKQICSLANHIDTNLFSYSITCKVTNVDILKPFGYKEEWLGMKFIPISSSVINVGKLFNSMNDFDYKKAYQELKKFLGENEDC